MEMDLLLEGGAAGHMNHLYDNGDLTFAKMKEIFTAAAEGKLEGTEKTDGQNLMISFSVKDGKAKGIRNTTDIINGGVDAKKMKERYASHENQNLQHTFSEAILAFENAVRGLDHKTQVELFGEDTSIYYNAEVMDPRTPNRINYDTKNLVIHRVGHKQYDLTTGKPIAGVDLSTKAAKLEEIISSMQDEIRDDRYGVQINAVRKLKALSDKKPLHTATSRLNSAISAVNYLIGEGDISLSDNSTINEYMIARIYILITSIINKQITSIGQISPAVKMSIVKRILGIKGISVTDIYKKVSPEQKNFLKQTILNDTAIRTILKTAIEPIEMIVSDFATDMLRGLESAFILNNDAQVKKLQDQVSNAITELEEYSKTDKPGAPDAMVFLKAQLKKLKSVERISAAAEGFVFDYDGVTYKFTGSFAPVNQILGVFDFGRGNIPPLKKELKEQKNKKILQEGKIANVAVVPGAFKPPHKGHIGMIQEYLKLADRVVVMVSPLARTLPDGRGVTFDKSKQIFELFLEELGITNVEIVKSTDAAAPVEMAYKFIGNENNNPSYAQPGETVLLGTSTKGGDEKRYAAGVKKYTKPGVKAIIYPIPELFDGMSATDMRKFIADKDVKNLIRFIPNKIKNKKEIAETIIDIFEGASPPEDSELPKDKRKNPEPRKRKAKKSKSTDITESYIYDIISEMFKNKLKKRNKKFNYKNIKEISASGAAAGYAVPIGKKQDESSTED